MNRCTDHRNVTEILLNTALITIRTINGSIDSVKIQVGQETSH